MWTRFVEATLKAPHAIQWLSDNGPQYSEETAYGSTRSSDPARHGPRVRETLAAKREVLTSLAKLLIEEVVARDLMMSPEARP